MYCNIDELILASASPRRRRFLDDLGLSFRVEAASIVEEPQAGESPSQFVCRMALDKARAISAKHPQTWVVSGDTVVSLGERIFGKPRHFEEAVAMLLELSGREHLVETAFCVCRRMPLVEVVRSVVTRVQFAPFDEATARAYAATDECLDKAGAYGIQGRGAVLVRTIAGSSSNVVGLPLWELLETLLAQGVIRLAGGVAGKDSDGG